VLGDFGGDGILLTVKRSEVIANLGCSFARADAPLVPDRNGRFVLAATIRTLGTSIPAVLRGTIVDATITLEIVTIAPDTIFRNQYTAVRDQPGLTGVICALYDSPSLHTYRTHGLTDPVKLSKSAPVAQLDLDAP
jgi:hypothetical protein